MAPFFLLVTFLIAVPAWAGGTISGTIVWTGPVPRTTRTVVNLDQEACGTVAESGGMRLGPKRGLRDAVVFIRGPVPGARPLEVPKDGFVIDQKQCRFVPHILLVPAETTVKVVNSDPTLHTVRTESRSNRPLNRAQSRGAPPLEIAFSKPEIFPVVCDVHSWMKGWIVVAEHAFYNVTDEAGKFRLENIPAGSYNLAVWHEGLGERQKGVVVKEGEPVLLRWEVP